MDNRGNQWRTACALMLIILPCFSGCSKTDKSQALGTLERDRVVLKATAAEIIIAEPVRESSLVKKGQLLVQLDDKDARAQVAHAQANLASARANQTKLRNGARNEDIAATQAQLEGARAQFAQANANFTRIEALARQKMVGQADLDLARSARGTAQAEMHRAQQNLLLLTNGTRPEDLLVADAQVAEAEANLALEESHLDDLNLVATRDGLLDRLPKYIGERVNIGDPLAILLAGNAPFARVYIIETARAKLRIGQTLNVHVDGYEKYFEGKLRWVSQDPAFTPYYALNSRDRAMLMYLAEIDLPESAKDLPSGLPAQVDLPDVDDGKQAR